MNVIEGVGLWPAAVLHEALFLASDTFENAMIQEGTAHHDQLASFGSTVQGEGETQCLQCRVGGLLYDPLADLSKGNLRIGSLQHCSS